MDNELESFKRLDLVQIAQALGYVLIKKESSANSKKLRLLDKQIVISMKCGKQVFFSIHGGKSGSAIDLVMTEKNCNLGHARKFLRSYFHTTFSTAQIPSILHPKAEDKINLTEKWHCLNISQVYPYLQYRGLNQDTLQLFAPAIRLDTQNNTCFKHQDRGGVATGWEVKNMGFKGFSTGGHKSLFAKKIGEVSNIFVMESAIDCMSFYQLHQQHGLYLSIGGTLSSFQITLLEYVITEKYQDTNVIVATDNDQSGERYFEQIQDIKKCERRRSKLKDWNDDLNLKTDD
ncbi:MAG: DUF3991 and TOPRIM domain-containing protein [Pseudomonadota bacterium]|nr:DUF3991 and TOPRIM domain-containing protein [Pseudomonadota bacterium]